MQPKNQTKTKIVSAATQCFIRKGFHSTSMRDIAGAANVSLGNFYNHFQSKTDLILAISDDETSDIAEAAEFFVTTKLKTLLAIKMFMAEYLKETRRAGVGVLMIEIAAEASRNREVAAAFLSNRNKLCEALSNFLSNGQQNGQIDTHIQSDQAAEFILDILEGLATRICLSGKPPSRAAVKEMNLLIERYLGA